MFNDIHLGPITLHMYGLMMAVGFGSALISCLMRSKKRGLSEDICYGIFYCAIIGGLLGCRILYYIVEIPNIIKNPSILWNFKVGYVVYGGIIGGILASYIYCKVKKARFIDYFDLVMPAVAMAQGFGRIGCFCAGCCYGRPTDAWWGITFKHSEMAPNGISLIPTQLISAAGDFIFAAILMYYYSRKPKAGKTASAYLILYGIGRFIIEFFRNDYRGSIGFLSTSQLISIGIVAIGVILFAIASKGVFEKAIEVEATDATDVKEENAGDSADEKIEE